jgi:molybdate/tungstate transport system substrate-binding protein
MKALADSFRTIYPGTEFLPEASGSLDCARKITELGRSCDILASADYSVIDQLLIPGHASENIPFAGNRMAIVFTPQSRYASEITPENWYEILLRDDVFYGRSDRTPIPADTVPCSCFNWHKSTIVYLTGKPRSFWKTL